MRDRVCAAMMALALVFVSLFGLERPARAEGDGMLRVRLTRLGAPSEIKMVADCDYYLAADDSLRIPAGTAMTLSARGDMLVLTAGSRRAELGASTRLMRAGAGSAGAQFTQPELSNRFCGDLGFSASGGVVNTVLNIYVEDYLYGVVGCEMPPSSPLEALKAQAVASRTYAMRKKAERAGAAYDITDTAADQVFRGYSGAAEYADVIAAVDATRGYVLYSGGALIKCYYCASNGGQTESSKNAWGTALSYSAVQDDPYDLESAAPVKTATINRDLTGLAGPLRQALIAGLTAQLEAQGVDPDDAGLQVTGIESITACDSRFAAPSRVYKSLTFQLGVTGAPDGGERRSGTVSVSIPTYGAFETWYDLSINDEDNETVWVSEGDRAFTVSFRRSGHGVGMSQRGAQVMAAGYGMQAREILAFYYPGAELRRLELASTARETEVEMPEPEQEAIATARLSDRTDLLAGPEDGAAATATAAAGAVVDVYGVQDEWAAVGSSGKYGYIRIDRLESFTLKGSSVVRPEGTVYAEAAQDTRVLQLPVLQASPVASMAAGSRVQVFAWTDAWAMVAAPNGFVGFVPLTSLDMAPDASEAEMDEADEPEAEPNDGIVTAEGDLYGQLREDAALYESASALSNVKATLYQGSLVKIYAYNESWARVRTQGGDEGYLPLESVRALDSAQLKAEDAGASSGVTRVSGTVYMYVKADETRVYDGNAADAQVIATLNAGDRVRLGAYDDRWAYVRLPDGSANGYVPRSALTNKAPDAPAGGAIAMAPAGTTATAVRGGVPVYRSYSEDSKRIAELSAGERVEIGAYNTEWALVRLNGETGYVRISVLQLERPAQQAQAGVTVERCDAVATARLNLYAAADTGGAVLAVIPKGASVRVEAWSRSYAYVSYEGIQGYVALKGLKRVS